MEIAEILSEFGSKKILVIGDVMLDVYLHGSSSRLTPEAPVPVVDVEAVDKCLGGAGNTACNFRSLGADVTIVSATGDDYHGRDIARLLADRGISGDSVLRIKDRTSLVKTRISSGGHVIARYDLGTTMPLSDRDSDTLIRIISEIYHRYDAIVISDYDKGVITEAVLDSLVRLRHRYGNLLAVDSKRLRSFRFLEPDLVKPNYDEALKLLSMKCSSEQRRAQLKDKGDTLRAATNAGIVCVTLDKDGAMFFEDGALTHCADAPAVASPRVSGAGDTFMAAFVLAHVADADVQSAAKIATGAAAVAVQKESTASCFVHELRSYLNAGSKFVLADDLETLCSNYRRDGKRIVFTNGCFDILHSGHVAYLRQARLLGDVLIVGINTDDSITRIKGPSRPVNSLEDRREVLSALSFVDHIVAFGSEEDDTPVLLIKSVRPHFFVKGGDYDLGKLPEADVIKQSGGQIVFITLVPDHSTTAIIRKINSGKEAGSSALTHHERLARV